MRKGRLNFFNLMKFLSLCWHWDYNSALVYLDAKVTFFTVVPLKMKRHFSLPDSVF